MATEELTDIDALRRRFARGIHITSTWNITPATTLTIEAANEKTTTHNTAVDINEQISGWDGSTVFRGPILNSFYSTTATVGVPRATASHRLDPAASTATSHVASFTS